MFERFTDPVTVVRVIQQGDLVRLGKLIAGGCRIDRRTTYDPWMTPLDASAATGNFAAAEMLLEGGAPIQGSSIYDAVAKDACQILRLFQKYDAKFYTRFTQEAGNRLNPRLNRWLSLFTALDFATSIHAESCRTFLEEIGAPKKAEVRKHRPDCTAVYIRENSFIVRGGVNIDGLTEITEGFYCAKCESFE